MAESVNSVSVVILTLNEEKHIERCIVSAFQVAQQVFVVDSFSTDQTVAIAQSHGALVLQHKFTNHAAQLLWAFENLPINTQWLMRVDADELISPALAREMLAKLSTIGPGTTGLLLYRRVCFEGKIIRYGGVSHWVLRMWRNGAAEIEQRWMDEHIALKHGHAARLRGEYFDDNLNGISWWTAKHNGYATREAIDLLNRKYSFLPATTDSILLSRQARYIRWLKENFYVYLPLGTRAFLYFSYRMIIRLGVLDGRGGFVFHFLQGFWYRFLVDVKVWEVERRMAVEKMSCVDAIREEFGVDLL